MDEILVGPNTPDDLEGLKEHLARPLLIDAERLEFRWAQAAAQPHIEASAGQIIEHRGLLGDKQRVPERQDVDHAAEADALRRSRRGGDQQIGRGDRRRRLEMMLEEPDLVDADTFRQLDFFELPLEHFHMGRFFARVVVDQIASRIVPSSRLSDGVPRAAAGRFMVPSAAGFVNRPPTHEAVYYCLLPQELWARGRLTFPV